jgi:transposase
LSLDSSGSLGSAALAATLFTLFQTLALWGIPVRRWLSDYLQACAHNGGRPPEDITPFLPWSLAAVPRSALSRPSAVVVEPPNTS